MASLESRLDRCVGLSGLADVLGFFHFGLDGLDLLAACGAFDGDIALARLGLSVLCSSPALPCFVGLFGFAALFFGRVLVAGFFGCHLLLLRLFLLSHFLLCDLRTLRLLVGLRLRLHLLLSRLTFSI